MSPSLPIHPRVPRGRSRIGDSELLVIERARALIEDLEAELERELGHEARPAERLRLLRETTNRITRTANDAIRAYDKARRAVEAELERNGPNAEAALATRVRLRAARLELLRALEVAGRRYPWAIAARSEASGASGTQKP